MAAALVLLYHYAFYLATPVAGRPLGPLLFGGGYAGVDIFFVISGFLMAYSTRDPRHAKPAAFSVRRFFRVVPLAQAATLAFFLIIAHRPPLRLLFQSLVFFPSAAANPPKFGWPVVPQEWTLAYELYFYALFAGALAVSHRRRLLVASLAIGASVVGFQRMLGGPFTWFPDRVALPAGSVVPAQLLGLLGNPLLLEFVAGMAMAAAYLRWGERLRAAKRGWTRLAAAALFTAFLACYFRPGNSGNGLLNQGWGAAALVAAGLLVEAAHPGFRVNAAALWLGTVSYPLYLVHFGIADRALRFACQVVGLPFGGWPAFVALTPFALLLAGLAHRWVERPCIAAGRALTAAISGTAPARSA